MTPIRQGRPDHIQMASLLGGWCLGTLLYGLLRGRVRGLRPIRRGIALAGSPVADSRWHWTVARTCSAIRWVLVLRVAHRASWQIGG